MTQAATVLTEVKGEVLVVTINRPSVRNCVDGPTAALLAEAFHRFEQNDALKVAILSGAGEHFCAGADLKAVASADPARINRIDPEGDGPMGPTRMQLNKPVIAAISGYAVAGGIELAAWCDLRVVDESAIFGVFCRRFGVPLIDGGTVRLPRLVGMSRAMDMILTGRPVDAAEALQWGLANRVVPKGKVHEAALTLATQLAGFPQRCMRNDRDSAYAQWGHPLSKALEAEFERGLDTMQSGETLAGASRFREGRGRHGVFSPAGENT